MPIPESSFAHLLRMSDGNGLYEHACFERPRIEHGYCTDDNARLLLLVAQEPDVGAPAVLGRNALRFVANAQDATGQFSNRMDRFGTWTDAASTHDHWGRALWGLGVAASKHGDEEFRRKSLDVFELGATQTSRWTHSMVFAALGAAHVHDAFPGHRAARTIIDTAIAAIGKPSDATWYWPTAKLTYSNAAWAEALIHAGTTIGDDASVDRGLDMLRWLLAGEMVGGHLSVTGTAGRTITDCKPQFDQQPIEVAAIADACWRAFTATSDQSWVVGIAAAESWFQGNNDAGVRMCDDRTGAGFDGLHATCVNRNQGAESTLAYLTTRQRALAVGIR